MDPTAWRWPRSASRLALFVLLASPRLSLADTLYVGAGETHTTVAAGLAAASSGDTVVVRSGTYDVDGLNLPAGITLRGESGPVNTKLHASNGGQAFIIRDTSNVQLEGFDIYAAQGVGPLTNALVYIERATNVTIRNCFMHDAPVDGDVVKLNESQDILIEDCVIWNPSERTGTPVTYQECIDIRGHGDARITLRGSWLFHTGTRGDYLLYAKGGTTDLLWENNIFGPSAGGGWGNVPVETGHLGQSDPTQYESERFVVRNNLFVGLRGTASFAFAGPNVSLLYNNVFYRNENIDRALIEMSANPALAGGPGVDLYSYNNIFHDNGSKPIYRVRDAATGANLTPDNNLYDTGVDGGDLSVSNETQSMTAAAPLFTAPSVPVFNDQVGTAQIRAALQGFRLQQTSPARGLGIDVVSTTGATHPDAIAAMTARTDAFGGARPAGAAWDAGLHHFDSVVPPDGGPDGGASDGMPPADGAAGDAMTPADGSAPGDGDMPGDSATDTTGSGLVGCGCSTPTRALPLATLLAAVGLLGTARRRRRR